MIYPGDSVIQPLNNWGQVLGIDESKWVFRSDSIDVLYWIQRESQNSKPFVANRVGEIQVSNNSEQWRYLPTKLNPFDLLTRGLSVSTLAEEGKWWSGPAFLKQDPSEWPENKIKTKRVLDAEIQKSHQIKEDTEEKAFLSSASEDQLEPERYWSWSMLTRVSAQVDRFIENCCLPVALRREGSLQTDEVISAGRWFIRPVLDEDGILQFDGRLC